MSETNGGKESGQPPFVAQGNKELPTMGTSHKNNQACLHGGTEKGKKAVRAMLDDLHILGRPKINNGAEKKTRARILKTASRILGPGNESTIVSELYAGSAEAILQGDVRGGQLSWRFAWIFRECVMVGNICGKEENELSKALGNSGRITRFVAERIPCDCLVDVKRRFKGSSNTVFCNACLKELSILQAFRCTKCKLVDYCSDECQRLQWKMHRPWCKARAKDRAEEQQSDNKKAAKKGEESEMEKVSPTRES